MPLKYIPLVLFFSKLILDAVTADQTFPSIGVLGGQAFVRPLLYWAGVYPGTPGYRTQLTCDLGGIRTRAPKEKEP